jgi:hypothetical protein
MDGISCERYCLAILAENVTNVKEYPPTTLPGVVAVHILQGSVAGLACPRLFG